MTSNQPTEQPQTQGQANAASEKKRSTPKVWALAATILVAVPVTSFLSHAAEGADVPHWATAIVSAVIVALTSFVLFARGTGGVRGGVLFGLWITFMLTAIDETALALDVSETWFSWVLAGPILAVWVWRYFRDGGESPL